MADEQVGNNSWITMTPGSAVAGQLQNILLEKRQAAHQALLDQIHARDVESQIRDRDENTKTNQEYRRGLIANRQALADQRRLADLGDQPAQIDPASDTAKFLRVAAPTRYKETPATTTLPSTQMAGGATLGQAPMMGSDEDTTAQPPVPAPALATQESPSISTPASGQFLGSSKYQAQHDTEAKLTALFNDPNFAKLPPEQQILKIAPIFPGTDPMAALERFLTSKTQQAPGHFRVYDENTATIKDLGPVGINDKTSLIPKSRPEPAPKAIAPYDAYDEQGNKVPLNFNPNTGKYERAELPPGLRIGGKLGPDKVVPPVGLYDDKAFKDFQAAARNAGPNASALRFAAATAFIDKIHDPEVKADVIAIRNEPAAKALPIEDLVKSGALSGPPEHIAKVKVILDILRGQ